MTKLLNFKIAFYTHLFFVPFLMIQSSLLGMIAEKKERPRTQCSQLKQINLSKEQEALRNQLMKNMEAGKSKAKFKLYVTWPTPNLVTIDSTVKANAEKMRSCGYAISQMKKRHLTMMTFHVPFPDGIKNHKEYAEHAEQRLADIVHRHVGDFEGVDLVFEDFCTLVNNKHIVVQHKFKTENDVQRFARAYTAIVREFLGSYDHCWMPTPFSLIPHVTIATRAKGTQPQGDCPFVPRGDVKSTVTIGYKREANIMVHAACKQCGKIKKRKINWQKK